MYENWERIRNLRVVHSCTHKRIPEEVSNWPWLSQRLVLVASHEQRYLGTEHTNEKLWRSNSLSRYGLFIRE